MPLPDEYTSRLIQGVYDGSISVFELPSFLYAYTVFELDGSFFTGFGEIPKGNIKAIEKAVNYRANIGRFSGVKTFQQVKDMTAFVFDENGRKRPFKEFAEAGRKINSDYNLKWLETEKDSVFTQSQNARKELRFIEEKDVFPMARYVTVGDDRVRPDHAALDGLTLPVDDPRWNTITPQNGWKCRCIKIQLEETRPTTKKEAAEKMRLIEAEFKKDKDKGRMSFDYNPGRVDFIFKEKGTGKHPYFKVPREFSQEVKNNFNFATVAEVTGKNI